MRFSSRWLTGTLIVVALAAILPIAALAAPKTQGSSYGAKVLMNLQNCGLTQVRGVVLDANGNHQAGVGVRLWWAGGDTIRTTSGKYAADGASGWEFALNTKPVANTWYVATENGDALLSQPFEVKTSGTCNSGDANVVLVEFRMGATNGTPAPAPAPSAPAPSGSPAGTTPASGEEAPALTSGASCQTISQTGYQVCNDGNANFLAAYQRYGAQNVGYPISIRYKRDGFITQAFQKAILQWRPESNTVAFANVFDDMHNAGLDQRLTETRQTPGQLPQGWEGAGVSFEQAVTMRQGLLNRPALRNTYFAASDPLTFFGLPTSEVTDMGNHYAIRLQRAVLQEWKETVPWAQAGQVTIANGGDIAKELGLIPAFAIAAQSSPVAGIVPPAPVNNPVPVSNPAPAAPPVSAPSAPLPSAAEPARNLDSRLGALGVGVQPASVASGQTYWRAVEVIWHDESQSGGRHAVQIDALDQNGGRATGAAVTVSWGGGNVGLVIENKPFPDYGTNFPMYNGGNSYSINMEGLPSDVVYGLGLGTPEQRNWNIHVEYLIKFQKVVKP